MLPSVVSTVTAYHNARDILTSTPKTRLSTVIGPSVTICSCSDAPERRKSESYSTRSKLYSEVLSSRNLQVDKHCYKVVTVYKVMFLLLSVILSTVGGVWQAPPLFRHPPPAQTPLSRHHHTRATTPLGRHLPGQTAPLRDGHCSGRYASYLNAFLFCTRMYCTSPLKLALLTLTL